MAEENSNIVDNFWMSNEAYFHLQPSTPSQTSSLLKGCGWWRFLFQATGYYFYKNEREEAVTSCWTIFGIVTHIFHSSASPEQYQWWNLVSLFQQDIATNHTARVNMGILNEAFRNHISSRNGTTFWPSYSPDSSACEFSNEAISREESLSNNQQP